MGMVLCASGGWVGGEVGGLGWLDRRSGWDDSNGSDCPTHRADAHYQEELPHDQVLGVERLGG